MGCTWIWAKSSETGLTSAIHPNSCGRAQPGGGDGNYLYSQKTSAEQELCVPAWPYLSWDYRYVPKIQRQLGKIHIMSLPSSKLTSGHGMMRTALLLSPGHWGGSELSLSSDRVQVAVVALVALPRVNPIACEGKGESWSDCPHEHKCHN